MICVVCPRCGAGHASACGCRDPLYMRSAVYDQHGNVVRGPIYEKDPAPVLCCVQCGSSHGCGCGKGYRSYPPLNFSRSVELPSRPVESPSGPFAAPNTFNFSSGPTIPFESPKKKPRKRPMPSEDTKREEEEEEKEEVEKVGIIIGSRVIWMTISDESLRSIVEREKKE